LGSLWKFNGYLSAFRKTIRQSAENAYKEGFNKATPPEVYQSEISFYFDEDEKTVSETHMSKTRVKVAFFEPQSGAKVVYVEFDITLELLLLKSGKFWFVADPMPEYTLNE
jgi:hypothetical protein